MVEKRKKDDGLDYTIAEISCGKGAKEAVCNVILVLVNPGDEVIVPAPYWVSYPEMVKLAEGTPVIVSAGIEQDFKITHEQLEASITPKTKALILCSPSNPTGSVYSKEELEGLAKVLEKPLSVGTEEISQNIAASSSSEPASQRVNSFYEAKINNEAEAKTVGSIQAIGKAFVETLSDGNSWEE